MIKSKSTIALFGGSFDPPHIGHQSIINELSKMNIVEQIIVMPNYQNPFKDTTFASAKQRLQWCRDIFDSSSGVIVSDYEVSNGKSTYTIETIKALNQEYIVKYLVIGSDNLEKIQEWKNFDEINRLIEWIVVNRGSVPKEHTTPLRKFQMLELACPISSTQIREGKKFEAVDSKIVNEVESLINNKGNK